MLEKEANGKKNTAIIVAAGRGRRMGGGIPKQYLPLHGRPVLYYALHVFQESIIDRIILVVPEGDEEYCRKVVVSAYGITKVTDIIAGGAERTDSVYKALQRAEGSDYVFIHDGVRPFITAELISALSTAVEVHKACITAVKVKDTIKRLRNDLTVLETQDRDSLAAAQTPQVFLYSLLRSAYDLYVGSRDDSSIPMTDDAQIVERMLQYPVYIVEGSYRNIKITTPEDLKIAELF